MVGGGLGENQGGGLGVGYVVGNGLSQDYVVGKVVAVFDLPQLKSSGSRSVNLQSVGEGSNVGVNGYSHEVAGLVGVIS